MSKARNDHVRQGLVALVFAAGGAGVWANGCAEAEFADQGDWANAGQGGKGGAMATGGAASETGGRSPSTGGTASGGTRATGGSAPTGGVSVTGGRSPTGGAPATGGVVSPTGGRSPTGGAPATGGAAPATGGVVATGGAPATGGSAPTGGTSSPPDNILMSYGFEQSQDPDGWRSRGTATLTITDEASHSGDFALKVTGRTAGWHGAEYDVSSLVTAGDAYDVTVWARLTSGSASSTLRLTREVQGCSGEQFVWLDSAENATAAAWVELGGTLTIPTGCSPSKLVVYVESTDATASYYVDDTSMSAQ